MSCDKIIDEFICKLQIKDEERRKENLYKKIVRILKEKR